MLGTRATVARCAALAGFALAAGCRGHAKKEHRASTAAPVEMVAQPQLPDAGVPGGTSDESEPNDADGVATPLALGGTVRGKIDPETDVDRYRIDVDKAGSLQVTLSGIEGVDLALELEDDGGDVLARSDRGGARVKEGLPNLGVTPGRYYAVVRAVPHKKPSRSRRRGRRPEPTPPPAPVYELSARMVEPPVGAEHEPDDDRGTANDLIVGDTATGFIGWGGDTDVWKLAIETLAAHDAIDVELSPVESVALSLEVDDGIGRPVLTRKAPRGAKLIVRGLVPVVPAGGSPFYYLAVSADRSNPETAYQLRVTAHVVGPDAEVEPDDTPDKPFPIPPDRTVVHATWTPGDVDCFAVAPAADPRTLDVTIDPKASIALAGQLLVDGAPAPAPPVHGRVAPGAMSKLAGAVPANGHAVICVHGADPAATAEGAYDVSVTETGGSGAP